MSERSTSGSKLSVSLVLRKLSTTWRLNGVRCLVIDFNATTASQVGRMLVHSAHLIPKLNEWHQS